MRKTTPPPGDSAPEEPIDKARQRLRQFELEHGIVPEETPPKPAEDLDKTGKP